MLSIATIWSLELIPPVPGPVRGPALDPAHEPALQPVQRNAARRTGRLASTYRAVKGRTVPFGRTVSDRPGRFRAVSVDLPRMSVV